MTEGDSRAVEQRSRGWLREHGWQVVQAALTIVAIVVAILVWRWQQQAKSLSYGIVSAGPLVSVQTDVASRVKVTFDGVAVPNVKIDVIRILNSGNLPIEKKDFDSPLTFTFGNRGKARILSADITGTSPPGIPVSTQIRGNTCMIKPTLWNPGDSITIRVLLAGGDTYFGANARIVGLPHLTETDFSEQHEETYGGWLLSAVSGCMAGLACLIGVLLSSFVVGRRLERTKS